MNICKSKGFTIIEMLLVVALFVSLSALTIPMGLTFFRAQVLNESVHGIISALRDAESRAAIAGSGDSFGIKIADHSYVLFKGSSYDERIPEYDEVVELPFGITTTGPEEIVFAPKTAAVSSYGTIGLELYGATRAVFVNEKGLVQ